MRNIRKLRKHKMFSSFITSLKRQSIMERCFASRKLAKAKFLKIHEVAKRYNIKV